MNIFLDVGGPSLFSRVHQGMNLTLLVRNKSITINGVLANCEMVVWMITNSFHGINNDGNGINQSGFIKIQLSAIDFTS